jgi:hypothetical protein
MLTEVVGRKPVTPVVIGTPGMRTAPAAELCGRPVG